MPGPPVEEMTRAADLDGPGIVVCGCRCAEAGGLTGGRVLCEPLALDAPLHRSGVLPAPVAAGRTAGTAAGRGTARRVGPAGRDPTGQPGRGCGSALRPAGPGAASREVPGDDVGRKSSSSVASSTGSWARSSAWWSSATSALGRVEGIGSVTDLIPGSARVAGRPSRRSSPAGAAAAPTRRPTRGCSGARGLRGRRWRTACRA